MKAAGYGGGIYCENFRAGSSVTLTVTNCILTGNAAYSGGGIANNNRQQYAHRD